MGGRQSHLRPFISFYGAKWRLAKRYPQPEFATIIEPFAGSAGYSVRYPDHDIVLIERDPIIAELWRYLIKTDADEIRQLPLLNAENLLSDFDLPDGPRALIGFWLGCGRWQPGNRPSPWMLDGKHDGCTWSPTIRERVASQVERIRHWEVIEGGYEDAPDIEATWFVDPPYQVAGRHYKYGSAGLDFARLGAWCQRRRGQVMVCENEGAAWLPFRTFREMTGVANFKRMEVMWTNGRQTTYSDRGKEANGESR